MATSEDRLAQIRARVAAMIPGSWVIGEVQESKDWALGLLAIRDEDGDLVCIVPNHGWPEQRANAAFIANAPADVPYLLQALADAETRAARLFSAAQRVAQLVTRLRRNDCDAAWAALDAALTDSTATPRPDAGQGVG